MRPRRIVKMYHVPEQSSASKKFARLNDLYHDLSDKTYLHCYFFLSKYLRYILNLLCLVILQIATRLWYRPEAALHFALKHDLAGHCLRDYWLLELVRIRFRQKINMAKMRLAILCEVDNVAIKEKTRHQPTWPKQARRVLIPLKMYKPWSQSIP